MPRLLVSALGGGGEAAWLRYTSVDPVGVTLQTPPVTVVGCVVVMAVGMRSDEGALRYRPEGATKRRRRQCSIVEPRSLGWCRSNNDNNNNGNNDDDGEGRIHRMAVNQGTLL
jgi:hypothetical protein